MAPLMCKHDHEFPSGYSPVCICQLERGIVLDAGATWVSSCDDTEETDMADYRRANPNATRRCELTRLPGLPPSLVGWMTEAVVTSGTPRDFTGELIPELQVKRVLFRPTLYTYLPTCCTVSKWHLFEWIGQAGYVWLSNFGGCFNACVSVSMPRWPIPSQRAGQGAWDASSLRYLLYLRNLLVIASRAL